MTAPGGRPRRGARAGATVLAVLVAVAVVASAAGVGYATGVALGRLGSPTAGVEHPADAASLRQVRALLEERSRAVVQQDEASFLAGVAPGDAAFLAEQRRLFANLRLLDLDTWRYGLVGGQTYRVPELAGRYDEPYLVVAVELRYAFAGFDRRPVARALGLTFVWRDGEPRLASESDVDELLPEAGHAEPWDVGAIAVAEGERALVIGSAVDSEELPEVAARADDAVDDVRGLWEAGWPGRVVLVVARDPRVWRTYFRDDRDPGQFAALAVPTFTKVPGWFPSSQAPTRLAGSRVVVNPLWYATAGAELDPLLRHEITHVALTRQTYRGAPTWLTEGTAEYTAYRGLGLAPQQLVEQARAGSLDLAFPSSVSFYTRDVARNYAVSWALCSAVAAVHGERDLARLYRELGRVGSAANTVNAVEETVPEVLGVTADELLAETEAWLASRG